MNTYKDFGYQHEGFTFSTSYILPVLQKMLPKEKCRILDVGCGNGAIARHLISLGYDVFGMDASEQGIRIAQKSYPERFFLQNLESAELPAEINSKKFDVIISTEVIETSMLPTVLSQFVRIF